MRRGAVQEPGKGLQTLETAEPFPQLVVPCTVAGLFNPNPEGSAGAPITADNMFRAMEAMNDYALRLLFTKPPFAEVLDACLRPETAGRDTCHPLCRPFGDVANRQLHVTDGDLSFVLRALSRAVALPNGYHAQDVAPVLVRYASRAIPAGADQPPRVSPPVMVYEGAGKEVLNAHYGLFSQYLMALWELATHNIYVTLCRKGDRPVHDAKGRCVGLEPSLDDCYGVGEERNLASWLSSIRALGGPNQSLDDGDLGKRNRFIDAMQRTSNRHAIRAGKSVRFLGQDQSLPSAAQLIELIEFEARQLFAQQVEAVRMAMSNVVRVTLNDEFIRRGSTGNGWVSWSGIRSDLTDYLYAIYSNWVRALLEHYYQRVDAPVAAYKTGRPPEPSALALALANM
jgi:hypothetical protein